MSKCTVEYIKINLDHFCYKITTLRFNVFDLTKPLYNNSTNAFLYGLVRTDRRSLSRFGFQQLTCLLTGIDAPWSGGLADGDSPGAFEGIWNRWVSFINLYFVQKGSNDVKKHLITFLYFRPVLNMLANNVWQGDRTPIATGHAEFVVCSDHRKRSSAAAFFALPKGKGRSSCWISIIGAYH